MVPEVPQLYISKVFKSKFEKSLWEKSYLHIIPTQLIKHTIYQVLGWPDKRFAVSFCGGGKRRYLLVQSLESSGEWHSFLDASR